MTIYTIGVYGKTEEEFYGQLTEHGIDVLVDIRERRGMRGAKYAFVNAKHLMRRLEKLGIAYYHAREFGASKELRELQGAYDRKAKVLKSERVVLAPEFIEAFRREVLEQASVTDLMAAAHEASGKDDPRVCLFCVEAVPEACHRRLVADEIVARPGGAVRHI